MCPNHAVVEGGTGTLTGRDPSINLGIAANHHPRFRMSVWRISRIPRSGSNQAIEHLIAGGGGLGCAARRVFRCRFDGSASAEDGGKSEGTDFGPKTRFWADFKPWAAT
jgi:hypothetical protein